MRVLLTGASGYLGPWIADFLADRGDTVVLAMRSGEKEPALVEWSSKFACVALDVRDDASVTAAFAGAPFDAVVHLASVNETCKDLDLVFAVNALGTKRVADAAALAGVSKFVFFSTFHVYGLSSGVITETTVPVPLHSYGISHLAGELFCRSAARNGMDLAILRVSNGFGAPKFASVDRWSLLMLDLCRQAHAQGEIRLMTAGYQLRDFVAIADILQAVGIVLDAPKLSDPILNVGAGSSIAVREVAHMVSEEFTALYGKKLPVHIPDGAPTQETLHFSIEKLRALGFTPKTDVRAEIRDILKFCERLS